jgi:O-antigen/teichoic acid export membrane protein
VGREASQVTELGTEAAAESASGSDPRDILDTSAAGGRVVRGGAVRFGTYVLTVALSVLSAALLTRHLGVVRFGQYTTVLSLVGVVAAITDAGMASLGTREFAVREGAARDELMRDLLGLRIVLTTLGLVLVTAFAVAADYDTALLIGAVLASLGTIALVVQHTHTIPLSAALRIGALSGLDLTRQVLTVVAIVVLVALDAGVLPLLAVTLAVNVVLIPPTAALARRQIELRLRFSPRSWLSLLNLTIAFALAAAVGTLYVYTAQILTSLVSTAHQSGLFAASFRIFIVVGAIPGLLVGGALPLLARAARDDRERLSYALERIFQVSLILGVAASLTALAGAQVMIDVVAGPKFHGSIEVLQIQGLAIIASFVLAGWSFGLLSLEAYRGILVVNIAALVTSCTLTAVLAASSGAKGAAIATVCGETVLALGSLLVLVRGRPEFRPRLAVPLKVAIATAPALAIALIDSIPSLVRTVLALGVYGALILLTRAAPDEVRDLLPPGLHRRRSAP